MLNSSQFLTIWNSKILLRLIVLVPSYNSINTTYIVSEITFIMIPPQNFLHIKLTYSVWNAEVSVHSPDSTKIHLHNNITNTVSRNTFWQNGEQYLRKWHFSLWTLSLKLQSCPRYKTEVKTNNKLHPGFQLLQVLV